MTSAEFRAIRRELGLSQAALGRELGITARQVSNLEQGKSQPRGAVAASAERLFQAHLQRLTKPKELLIF